jgi:hypothetical protein
VQVAEAARVGRVEEVALGDRRERGRRSSTDRKSDSTESLPEHASSSSRARDDGAARRGSAMASVSIAR